MRKRDGAIRPYEHNTRYWQYKGRPTLLLGGSDEDNIWQRKGKRLTDQLNLMAKSGANYDRCVMSFRDPGNASPYRQLKDGTYDLDQFNDECWQRFERYLKECDKRDIIVQVEMWATYDYISRWEKAFFNPANNVSYDGPPDTQLKASYRQHQEPFDFYYSIPELHDDQKLLKYQQAFVDKVLSYALRHDNVLYCIDNEYHANQPWQWFRYWTQYIKAKADEAGKQVFVTEMNIKDWFLQGAMKKGGALPPHLQERLGDPNNHVFNRNHLEAFDHPEIYDYVDFSDNADYGGQEHWDNLQAVREYTANDGRPVNHDKIYGADFGVKWPTKEGIAKFWRNIVGGAAACRFHRPQTGIGISRPAQASLKAARRFEQVMKPWECEPRPDLIKNREADEAYLIAKPGERYGLFFTDAGGDGWVKVNFEGSQGEAFTIRWINIATGAWSAPTTFLSGGREGSCIQRPFHGSDYGWAAVIERKR